VKQKEKQSNIERVYLDKKQLALNKSVLKSINPELLEHDNSSEISKDDRKIEIEIGRLHKLL
jgi:hypothetical protein